MPRQIWNEGRVVGYSAYEVYVKHAMSIDPKHEPATEKEWLASMMAMGSSMLLRIGADPEGSQYDGVHYRDIQFPADSRLCAASNVIASLFEGEGYVGTDSPGPTLTAWATKVIDYGSLIKNNPGASPSGKLNPNGFVPPSDITAITDSRLTGWIKEYAKIIDGVIIQPGTWVANSNPAPQKDFTPTMSEHPRLRISFSERITTPFFLLLTGFTNRSVVTGVTGFFDPQKAGDNGFGSAVNTQSPQDGDFLGPWAFPWAAKVIFSVPASYISQFMTNKYERSLPTTDNKITVNSDPIIDLKQSYTDTESNYYGNICPVDPSITADIAAINHIGEDSAILATYIHSNYNGQVNGYTTLPPALYAALVNTTGDAKFYPVDSVAPWSLKMYDGDIDDDSAGSPIELNRTLELKAPGATGFMRDLGDPSDIVNNPGEYVIYQRDKDTDMSIPVAKIGTQSLLGVLTIQELVGPSFMVEGTELHQSCKVYSNISTDDIKILNNIGQLNSSLDATKGYVIPLTEADGVAKSGDYLWRKITDTFMPDAKQADGTYKYTVNGFVNCGRVDMSSIDTRTINNEEKKYPKLYTGIYYNEYIFNTSAAWYITKVNLNSNKSYHEGKTIKATDSWLNYCSVGIQMVKRISGVLSDKLHTICGYDTVCSYDASGKLVRKGVFAEGEIWESATLSMFEQIPSDEIDQYYAIIPGGYSNGILNNNIVWPVRKDTNILDVTIRYTQKIISNGVTWNPPAFTNSSNDVLSSKYLSSWWGARNDIDTSNPDAPITTTVYSNAWAHVEMKGVKHTSLYDEVKAHTSGQVYIPNAMLNFNYSDMTMSELFGETAFVSISNSNPDYSTHLPDCYKSMKVIDFLKRSLYADMGVNANGNQQINQLPSTNSNITQTQPIYASAYWYGTYKSTPSISNIRHLFNIDVNNTATTSGKTQLVYLPEQYKDQNTTDPLGVMIQTGRLQGMALSMVDRTNKPYSIYGNTGVISLPDDMYLTWEYLLNSLSQNKKLDVLGSKLRQLSSALTNATTGTYKIQINNNGSISLIKE